MDNPPNESTETSKPSIGQYKELCHSLIDLNFKSHLKSFLDTALDRQFDRINNYEPLTDRDKFDIIMLGMSSLLYVGSIYANKC